MMMMLSVCVCGWEMDPWFVRGSVHWSRQFACSKSWAAAWFSVFDTCAGWTEGFLPLLSESPLSKWRAKKEIPVIKGLRLKGKGKKGREEKRSFGCGEKMWKKRNKLTKWEWNQNEEKMEKVPSPNQHTDTRTERVKTTFGREKKEKEVGEKKRWYCH